MKKIIFVVVVVVLAAVNVNLAFNSDDNFVNLSLASITALARGETTNCSICGYDVNHCSCDLGITCDYGSCTGKVCHYNLNDWSCRCASNGNPLSFCI